MTFEYRSNFYLQPWKSSRPKCMSLLICIWEGELGGGSWIGMREGKVPSFDANKDLSSGLLTMHQLCQQLFFFTFLDSFLFAALLLLFPSLYIIWRLRMSARCYIAAASAVMPLAGGMERQSVILLLLRTLKSFASLVASLNLLLLMGERVRLASLSEIPPSRYYSPVVSRR